jgi:hypothetical protein
VFVYETAFAETVPAAVHMLPSVDRSTLNPCSVVLVSLQLRSTLDVPRTVAASPTGAVGAESVVTWTAGDGIPSAAPSYPRTRTQYVVAGIRDDTFALVAFAGADDDAL